MAENDPKPGLLTNEEKLALKNRYDLEEKINLLMKDRFEISQAQEKMQKAAEESARNALNNFIEKKKQVDELQRRIISAEGEQRQELEKQLETANEQLETAKEMAKEAGKHLETTKEQIKEDEKRAETQERIKNLHKEITTSMVESLASSVGLSGVVKNISSGLGVGASLMLQFVDNAKELFNTVMEGNSAFAASTGQIADRSIMFGYGASQFGIGFEKLNKASISLFTSMANFSNQTMEVQENLALSAAKMELFGVSAETTGKNFESLTLGLKMSSDQAIATNDEIAKAAIGAGIAPSKMLSEFASNMPKLAAYGKQGIQVYVDMQKQAKSLGIELNNLNSIVGDQFDTFEGAARAAGKFNAVLGGNYLNSVEMLNATESERILLLKQSFDASGKNFDSLSKFEKKAVAATLGIQDLNEASKLFGKSTADLTMDLNKQAATQEKLEEVQREAAKTTDQVKEIFNALLVIVRPVVFVIKEIINLFTRFNDALFGIPAILIAVVAGITTLGVSLVLFGGTMASSIASLMSFGAAAGSAGAGAAAAAGPVSGAITSIGQAMTKSSAGFLSFAAAVLSVGAAVALIGVGVYVAATGLATLVKSFKDLGDSAPAAAIGLTVFMIAFGLMMGALISLVAGPQALLTTAAIGVLLSIGAAALMIGGGVALAANGIANLVNSFTNLNSALKGSMSGFSQFKDFLSFINEEKITSLEKFSSSFKDSLDKISIDEEKINKFSTFNTVIGEMVQALSQIPDEKITNLKVINDTISTARSVTTDEIKPSKEFLAAASDYYKAQSTAKEADKDALVAAFKELTKAMKPEEKAGGREEGIPVKLVISGTELASALRDGNRNASATIFGLRTP